jgi:hypothetical protein
MKKSSINKNKTLNVRGLIICLAVAVMFVRQDAMATQAPVALGSDVPFAVLAATTVTTIPTTTVNGDLGVSPGNTVTGSPIVNGTIHLADPTTAQAQLDLTVAYNDAAGRTVGAITVAGNLGGQTLAPGLYTSATSLEISSGDLTLDAQGDPNAVWIFQMGTTLITTVGRQVILSGGAQAANVFWQVGSSATIGGSSVFKGTILADQSITMDTGATLEGRALARNGAVALDANTITVPTATLAVVLQSAAVCSGFYADALGQTVNLATKTLTVPLPLSGNVQFYRIRSSTALTITSVTISGGNVLITYL